ncbi:fimbrillin family protein [uncultured Bacteroides sp.]|uniref:fimbrillin family protein n=1 Tax=uncultured Bacteroides sp. TaxID=162156 RepID=UPI0025CBAEC0|nr:fimbrillin family protein [uncultured Bacteroides sp.]
MKKNYVMIAFTLLLLAGCSTDVKESDIKFAGETGMKVSFSAVINSQTGTPLTQTRATDTEWEVGDSVGITCGDNQQNIHYKYTGNADNMFAAKGGVAEEIWVLGTQEYGVSAYCPFMGTSGVTQGIVNVLTNSENQATSEKRKYLDFLYATAKASAAQPNVKLSFYHKMSRIKIKFEAGDGVSLSDIDCYLIGLKLDGTFNTSTGATVVSESATPMDIYWGNVGQADNHTMEAILLPQEVTDKVSIQARMEGRLYEVQFPKLAELETGVSYNYTIEANMSVDQKDYVFTITKEGTQINDWTVEEEEIKSDSTSPDTGAATDNPNWSVEDGEINASEKK